jgi:hypothetical protein
VKCDDAGIARRKITPAALRRAHHQIELVAGRVFRQQRRLHVAAPAIAHRCLFDREAIFAQPAADFR